MSRRRASGALARVEQRAAANIQAIHQSEAERSPSRMIPVDSITPSPFQARRDFSSVPQLVEDIRVNGVLQPVLVRPLGGGRFELVAGERRWRASREAGKANIPAVVREMTDQEARIYSLKENLQREDLNAYELARAVLDLAAAQAGRSPDELRQELGTRRPGEDVLRAMDAALDSLDREMSLRTYQRHYLPLLRLPPRLLDAIEQGAPYSSVALLRDADDATLEQWLPRLVAGEVTRYELAAELVRAKRAAKGAALLEGESYDLAGKVKEVRGLLTETRVRALDGHKQRKARRLLAELAGLLEGKEG